MVNIPMARLRHVSISDITFAINNSAHTKEHRIEKAEDFIRLLTFARVCKEYNFNYDEFDHLIKCATMYIENPVLHDWENREKYPNSCWKGFAS